MKCESGRKQWRRYVLSSAWTDSESCRSHPVRIGAREVLIDEMAREQVCPDCGIFSARVYARWTQRVNDLPPGTPLPVGQVGLRRKRLRASDVHPDHLAAGTGGAADTATGPGWRLRSPRGPCSTADVAREYAVSWWPQTRR